MDAAQPVDVDKDEMMAPAGENGDLRDRVWRMLGDGPYLPTTLIISALLIILTHAVLILAGQPAGYLADNSLAAHPIYFMRLLLSTSFLLFGLLVILYLVVVGLGLWFLSAAPASALWAMVCFAHLYLLRSWLNCDFGGFFHLGSTACTIYNGLVLALPAGILGILFGRRVLAANAVVARRSERRLTRPVAAVAGVWLIILVAGLVYTALRPATGWVPVVAERAPAPRTEAAIAYDTLRQQALLFGGLTGWAQDDWVYQNDTWLWDGRSWTEQQVSPAPSPRIVSAMAYDRRRDRVVLFGGKDQTSSLNDTWEWDGSRWLQKFPGQVPSPRCCHRMVFDEARGRVVLYGGFDEFGTGLFYNDGWEWDGDNWYPIYFDVSTPEASNFDMVFEQHRERNLVFMCQFPNTTWSWQLSNWQSVEPAGDEIAVASFKMAYDPIRQHSVLFGYSDAENLGGETWIYAGDAWEPYSSPRTPAGRWGQVLFYDTIRQRVMMFGGFDGSDYLNDMWELALE